tara:strand:+ start:419 stop:685 length:267 start_codon:yes stop_codon:yes gene_type:complete
MKKVLSLIILMSIPSVAFAGSWPMNKFDVNGDKILEISEIRSICAIKDSIFAAADKNKDGTLSVREARDGQNYLFRSISCRKVKNGRT